MPFPFLSLRAARTRVARAALTTILCASAVAPVYACTVKVGVLLALTGSMSEEGQSNTKSALLAAHEINAAGGVDNCTVKPIVADTQTEPSVAVSQAKALIDLRHAKVLIGSNSSGTTVAELRSVTAPSGVLLVSPSAASTVFTKLDKSGKTAGLFMRTVMSVGKEGPVVAYFARHTGHWKRVSIVYVNDAFGASFAKHTAAAFRRLGGTARLVPYNINQSDYASVVTDALSGHPQALLLLAHPYGGEIIMRGWLQNGGPRHVVLAESLATQRFVDKAGGKLLNGAWAVRGSAQTASTGYKEYREAFVKKYGAEPSVPYDSNAFDATAITLLAMQAAHGHSPQAIFAAARRITSPGGMTVSPNVASFKKALAALKAGKKVHYVGATGALSINKFGDVQNPLLIEQVKGGKLLQVKTLSVKAVNDIVAKAIS